ncbi:MAG: DJ-1/PfpI family protein [Cyclobacteriaceae bacterium]
MKKILITLLVVIASFSFSCESQQLVASNEVAWYCKPCGSSCDKVAFDKAGKCTHCGMELSERSAAEQLELLDNKMTIAFYLQNNVEVLDFAGPMEVFAYAGYEVFTVSKTREPIKTQNILTFIPDYSIEDAPAADIMAFFGGNSGAASGDKAVINWVKSRIDETDYFFSVCTGAFVMGEAGLLDGRTVTTFHNAIDGLTKSFPKATVRSDVRFVDNGNVITTAGVSAGIDGALHLVAKLDGLQAAKDAAFYMEYDKWKPGEGLILDEETKAVYAEK